jgi:hypothetical protein
VLEHSLVVDLAVDDTCLTLSPSHPNAGESATATLDVHNAGDFPTVAFTIDLYVGEPGAGGVLVATSPVPGPFAAGGVAQLALPFVMPAGGGDVIAVVDAAAGVTELSEANNRATWHLTNRAPTAVVKASVTGGALPLAVGFDATLSTDQDGDQLSHAWAFSDGSQSATGALIGHTFTVDGRYPVTLAVTDEHGAVGTAVVVITAGAAPAAPAGLHATAAGGTWVELAWTDASANELGFTVYVGATGGVLSAAGTVAAGETSYLVEGLEVATSYDFQVEAFNAIGSGARSNLLTASTADAALFTDGFEAGTTGAWSAAVP